MTFVVVDGNPTRDQSETITKLWQTSLWNNHIQAERCISFVFKTFYKFSNNTFLNSNIFIGT